MPRVLQLGVLALLAASSLQPLLVAAAQAQPVHWSGNAHLYEVGLVPEWVTWVDSPAIPAT